MFIGTSYQTNQIDDKRSIYLDGCKLTRVAEAKFLGITLDSNLTWIPHINAISKKCSKNLGVLNKVKHFLPETAMYQLYCTLILLPYLNYGILLWGSAYKQGRSQPHSPGWARVPLSSFFPQILIIYLIFSQTLLYATTYKKHVDKILKIQKRAIRIISNSSCSILNHFSKNMKPLISMT